MRMWITGAIATAVLLLGAGPARAAFDVTAFEVTPSSTAAGAHADVTIATSFTPYSAGGRQPRNLTFHLPPGLAGDPFATPRCTEVDYRADKCPPATKVGTADADRVGRGAEPAAAAADRDGRPLQPRAVRLGARAARRGAAPDRRRAARQAVRPDGRSPPARPTAGWTRSSPSCRRTLPTTGELAQVYTERMAFTLQGRPAGGTGPFMRNPTSCNPATSTVEATPYGEPAATGHEDQQLHPHRLRRARLPAAHRRRRRCARADGVPLQAAGPHARQPGRRAGRPGLGDRHAPGHHQPRPHAARARMPGRAGQRARLPRERARRHRGGRDTVAREAADRRRVPRAARGRTVPGPDDPARRPDPAAAQRRRRALAAGPEDDIHRSPRRPACALPARPRRRPERRVPARAPTSALRPSRR